MPYSIATQVEPEHYGFLRYVSKARWTSIYHQIEEILKLDPISVLEIGPGSNLTTSVLRSLMIDVKTLDFDKRLNPDYVGSVLDIPISEKEFDTVCAFQVLEHIPYENFVSALREMGRVARKNILISLPDARTVYYFTARLPKFGAIKLHLPLPFWSTKEHVFNGEHYWEINKKGYSLDKVIGDIEKANLSIINTFRVHENPYHRFFILACK